MDDWPNHNRLEIQFLLVANSSLKAPHIFPSQSETNPIECCDATTLRSDKVLKKPKMNKEDEDDIRSEEGKVIQHQCKGTCGILNWGFNKECSG